MNEIAPVMSVKEYFEKYAVNGIGKGMDRIMIKNQLVDAFQKEIFGLVAIRAKKKFDDIPEEGDPEALRIAQNVIKEEVKKWKSLIKLFEKYRETSGLLTVDDLRVDMEPAKPDPDIPEDAVVVKDEAEVLT